MLPSHDQHLRDIVTAQILAMVEAMHQTMPIMGYFNVKAASLFIVRIRTPNLSGTGPSNDMQNAFFSFPYMI